jgi:hypothetical protein
MAALQGHQPVVCRLVDEAEAVPPLEPRHSRAVFSPAPLNATMPWLEKMVAGQVRTAECRASKACTQVVPERGQQMTKVRCMTGQSHLQAWPASRCFGQLALQRVLFERLDL